MGTFRRDYAGGFFGSPLLEFSPCGSFLGNGWQLVALGGDGTPVDKWGSVPGTAAFFPNGSKIASVMYGASTIDLWPVQPDEEWQMFPLAKWEAPHIGAGDHDPVQDLAFSPDGNVLAAVHLLGTVNLWRASDGSLLGSLDNETFSSGLAFSPDGLLAVVGERHDTETGVLGAAVKL